jgi:hypothetical protein
MYGKQGADFIGLLRNVWGWIYWISRGLIPLGTYLVWYFAQSEPVQSIAIASVCGLGSEAILRSKFYLTSETANGKSSDISKGFFDLIEWWQSLCLRQAGIARAGARQAFVEKELGQLTDFVPFAQRMKLNASVFSAEVTVEIGQKVDAMLGAFEIDLGKPNANPTYLNKAYIAKLGYALLDSVGKSGIRTLNR